MLCNMDKLSHFWYKWPLAPVTPNDARLTFDPTKQVEMLKLMHIYKFYSYSM